MSGQLIFQGSDSYVQGIQVWLELNRGRVYCVLN